MALKHMLMLTLCLSIPLQATALPSINKLTRDQIALSFDDGPSPQYTPQVLKILKKYKVKATFFVMGAKAKRYPELIRQIKADGHVIANHTYTHPKLTRMKPKRVYQEIAKTSNIIQELTGERPLCLRPPFGLHNKRIDAIANELGMVVVMWGWNSFDYNKPGVNKIVNEVIKNTPAGTSVLLHDGGKAREQTIKALPRIIKGLRRRGLNIVPMCAAKTNT